MKKSKLSSSLPRLNHFLHKSRRSSIKNAKGIAQEIQKQAERPYVKTKGFFNQSIPNAYAKYLPNLIKKKIIHTTTTTSLPVWAKLENSQKTGKRLLFSTQTFYLGTYIGIRKKYFGNGISQVLQLPLGHLSIGFIFFVYKDKTLVCCNMLMALCRFLINIYLQTVSNFVNCNNRIFGCVHHTTKYVALQ